MQVAIFRLHEHVHVQAGYRFLDRQCIGSVEVQVKLNCNARGYYTIPGDDVPCPQMIWVNFGFMG